MLIAWSDIAVAIDIATIFLLENFQKKTMNTHGQYFNEIAKPKSKPAVNMNFSRN
jgi:hypothetical protein